MTDTVESELRAEIDRLRVLLQAATKKRMALSLEIEPSRTGFRVVLTGASKEDELRHVQMVADYLNILWKGALRFTVGMYDQIHAQPLTEPEQATLENTLTLATEESRG